MFSKTLIFATAVLPAALGAIVFNTPTNVTSGLVSNITWTADDTDPTFSLELNHPSFSNSIAIGNNIDPTLETLSIEWPIVPADVDYSLSAVNIGNISNIFAQSSDFAIAQAPTSASASISTTFSVSSSSGTGTVSTTGSASGTGSASSGSQTTATSQSGSATPTSSSFNGAASLKTGNAASGLLAAILVTAAGATLFL